MAGEKMLEPGKRRIGIYGGTFNPPHSGHVHLARTLAQALGLERVLIIPANLPPHKQAHELAPGAFPRREELHLRYAGSIAETIWQCRILFVYGHGYAAFFPPVAQPR